MGKADDVLRKFEREVLDKHYATLPLWRRPRDTATFAALAQFDCWAILSLLGFAGIGTVAGLQRLKNLEEGLSEALRWLHPGEPQVDLTPTGDRRIIEEAGEFCSFAAEYVNIADFHKMYGRGQVEIEIDDNARRVRFVMPKARGRGASIVGIAEQSHRSASSIPDLGAQSLLSLRENAMAIVEAMELRYESGHVSLADVTVANDPSVRSLLELWVPEEPFPLSERENMIGFTAGEFDVFFGALRRWSLCCTCAFLHSVSKRKKQQWECAATQCMPRAEFLSAMRVLTDLSEVALERIVERLTYRRSVAWPDVYLQPLFCGPQRIAWSASVIQASKHQRNMLKLMSRMESARDHAATLIGLREGPMLEELGRLLARRGGCAYKLHTAVSAGGEAGELDLLAYNHRSPGEVLIVEGKAVLGVDEINEVESATKDMQEGQGQIVKLTRILEKMSMQEKRTKFKFVDWSRAGAVYGVVVAADAEPSNNYDHSEYPGISLQTIKARLRDSELAAPHRFWSACKERKWLEAMRSGSPDHRSIDVGGVTYELPVLGVPARAART